MTSQQLFFYAHSLSLLFSLCRDNFANGLVVVVVVVVAVVGVALVGVVVATNGVLPV
jgi:hypothetical protein